MIFKKRPKERIRELRNPGDEEPTRCAPGSIEQQLDMCEEGSLRGDEILFEHGLAEQEYTGDPQDLDKLLFDNFNVDLSEVDREGDEMSGDEHTSGLEGGEPEIEGQLHISTSLPGDRTKHEEIERLTEEFSRERRDISRSSDEGSISIRRPRRARG
jgi:hypothetical protein